MLMQMRNVTVNVERKRENNKVADREIKDRVRRKRNRVKQRKRIKAEVDRRIGIYRLHFE